MKPLAALLALLVLVACGQAVDEQTSDDAVQPDSDLATDDGAGNRTTTRSSTPRALPEEPAPAWRTCQTGDDCELRDSVCAPLAAGGLPVCRRERAQAGEACTGDNACEPGLTCDEGASTCRPFELRGGETDDRKPLACEPDGSTVDAHCETETVD